MVGNGYVNINDVNLLRVLEVVRNMSSPAAAPGNSNLADFNTRFTRLTRRVTRIENRSVYYISLCSCPKKRSLHDIYASSSLEQICPTLSGIHCCSDV